MIQHLCEHDKFHSAYRCALFVLFCLASQECESKIAQEIASLSKEDVSKEEMTENEEEVINLLLTQVSNSTHVKLHVY